MLGMPTSNLLPVFSPRTLLGRNLGRRSLGLALGMLLRLCFGLNLRVVLLNRFPLQRGQLCAIGQELLDQPSLAGDSGILFNCQHHHKRVRNHKQDHKQRKKGSS